MNRSILAIIVAVVLVPVVITLYAKKKMGKLDKGAIVVIVWITIICAVLASALIFE